MATVIFAGVGSNVGANKLETPLSTGRRKKLRRNFQKSRRVSSKMRSFSLRQMVKFIVQPKPSFVPWPVVDADGRLRSMKKFRDSPAFRRSHTISSLNTVSLLPSLPGCCGVATYACRHTSSHEELSCVQSDLSPA